MASQRWEAAVMATSTSWPSPERSRSHSAAMIAKRRHQPAAAEVGDLHRRDHRRAAALAREREHPVARQVVEVVARAIAVGPSCP